MLLGICDESLLKPSSHSSSVSIVVSLSAKNAKLILIHESQNSLLNSSVLFMY